MIAERPTPEGGCMTTTEARPRAVPLVEHFALDGWTRRSV